MHIYVCVCLYIYVCVFVNISVCVCICVYVCAYEYACAFMNISVYMCMTDIYPTPSGGKMGRGGATYQVWRLKEYNSHCFSNMRNIK